MGDEAKEKGSYRSHDSVDASKIEMRLRLSELDHKIGSLLLADKYRRILHVLEIILLVLILFW